MHHWNIHGILLTWSCVVLLAALQLLMAGTACNLWGKTIILLWQKGVMIVPKFSCVVVAGGLALQNKLLNTISPPWASIKAELFPSGGALVLAVSQLHKQDSFKDELALLTFFYTVYQCWCSNQWLSSQLYLFFHSSMKWIISII